jgi:hypothetical protein
MFRIARALPPALVAAAVLLGCGAQEEPDADRFSGEEKAVAQVVDDLQSAAEEGDAAEICSRLLARSFVDQLAEGGSNCTAELDKAIDDADNFELEVRDVALAGTSATAVVRDEDGVTRSLSFRREGGGWRAASLQSG